MRRIGLVFFETSEPIADFGLGRQTMHELTEIWAEVGLAHEGSLDLAVAYVESLASAGVDVVKFQMHLPDWESSVSEPLRRPDLHRDRTRQDYWRRTAFSIDQWTQLADVCAGSGVQFVATPFSRRAVQILEDLGVQRYKVGSGDTTNEELLEAIGLTKRPVVLSTGMSTIAEVDVAVDLLQGAGAPEVTVLQCTSKYPTPIAEIGLNLLNTFSRRYGARAGLSLHVPDVSIPILSLPSEPRIIEVHSIFDRRMSGPDARSSLSVDDIAVLVSARDAWTHLRMEVDKDAVTTSLAIERTIFGRSLGIAYRREAGHVLSNDDFVMRKPGGGLPWAARHDLLGRSLRTTVDPSVILSGDEVERG